jgi:hypothetical protein
MTAKPVVAATDGSREALRAVEWAARKAMLRCPRWSCSSSSQSGTRHLGSSASTVTGS